MKIAYALICSGAALLLLAIIANRGAHEPSYIGAEINEAAEEATAAAEKAAAEQAATEKAAAEQAAAEQKAAAAKWAAEAPQRAAEKAAADKATAEENVRVETQRAEEEKAVEKEHAQEEKIKAIHAAYAGNQARFSRDYKGRSLTVNLPLIGVTDIFNAGKYSLSFGTGWAPDVTCNDVPRSDFIISLNKGDVIHVRGTIADHSFGMIMLNNCELSTR